MICPSNLGFRIEPIENGYLVVIDQPEPEEWDKDSPSTTRIAGIDVGPTKTWFAKDEDTINKILKVQYFARR